MAELNNSGPGQWSEADGNNTSPPPDGAPVGTFPNQAEGIWRAIMGALKRFWDRINGTVTTTGTAGAYVYTPANASFPTAYVQGETYVWRANFTSVGSDTLNINGLGARGIYKPSTNGMTAIAAGDIQSGQIVHTVYDGNLNSGAGGFQLMSPVAGGLASVADATNGGLNFSASTGSVTAKIAPGDLSAKSSPVLADLMVGGDSANSNAAVSMTLTAIAALLMPTGSVMPFAGPSAPSGWLLCYGQAVSRTTYAALFALVSTTYGSGDGSTTFNVPDLRGRVVAGVDNMGGTAANRLTSGGSGISAGLGNAGGAETVTQTSGTLVSHNHSISFITSSGGSNGFSCPGSNSNGSGTGNAGSGNPAQNTQPTMELNYIIKT